MIQGSYPNLKRPRARGGESTRVGQFSLVSTGSQFVTKKENTPGQRSREDSGVHPGHSLFSREEAAGERGSSSLLLAAFSISCEGLESGRSRRLEPPRALTVKLAADYCAASPAVRSLA